MLQVRTEPRADSQCRRESVQDTVTSHVAPQKIPVRDKNICQSPSWVDEILMTSEHYSPPKVQKCDDRISKSDNVS